MARHTLMNLFRRPSTGKFYAATYPQHEDDVYVQEIIESFKKKTSKLYAHVHGAIPGKNEPLGEFTVSGKFYANLGQLRSDCNRRGIVLNEDGHRYLVVEVIKDDE